MTSDTTVIAAVTDEHLDTVRFLFKEYAESIGIDLCFQAFEEELQQLPGDYAAPRGALLIAMANGQCAGCCALRPLDSVDYANASEMKRLYVRRASWAWASAGYWPKPFWSARGSPTTPASFWTPWTTWSRPERFMKNWDLKKYRPTISTPSLGHTI
jgi:hypothetical protein